MPISILATKLFISPPRPTLIQRQRLLASMDAALRGKLTLISAPAGFGKTTLVSAWIDNLRFAIDDFRLSARQASAIENRQSQIVNQIAWLSLDEEDSNPVRFFIYLVAALRTVAPDLGEGVLKALQSAQPPPLDSLLTALLNEIAAAPEPFVLVLDDYHVIDNQAIDDALSFLLDHLPPQLHLIITTREDPRLPLSRLRARGQLTEIRAADLRFTADEAAAFLNQAMGLTLSTNDVAALEARTEGWIAGLQLAALALQATLSRQGNDDVHSFVAAFAGDNRYVVDYLVDEVLARQPETVRAFLLQTSILERLSGPLCDAVTGQEDGKAMLAALERDNLFVVPLDQSRQWFRYHHLFADVLRAHLREEEPARLPQFHSRAAHWYEENDQPAAAIRHALAAADFEYAAMLIERQWHSMDANLQSEAWLRWVNALPSQVLDIRPVLSLGYGWALLNVGQLEAAERRLREAERWLDPEFVQSRPQMVVIDKVTFGMLEASIAAARAYAAQAMGDAAATIAYAHKTLDLLPDDDHVGRRVAAAILGLAYWRDGKLSDAYRNLTTALTSFERTGHIPGAISGAFGLADICITQGRLRDANETYRHALALVAEIGDLVFPGVAELHVGLGEVHLEMGDVDAAFEHMQSGQALGEKAVLAGDMARLLTVMARIEYAQGHAEAAFSLLDEAERVFVQTPVPNVRPTAAWRAHYAIRQGRLAEARRWAQSHKVALDDELDYLTEFEHMTLARLLLTEGAPGKGEHLGSAQRLLERLLVAAEAGGRAGSVIEIRVLQALAHHVADNLPAALTALAHALSLAAAEGYVYVFVAEGAPMAALLRAAVKEDLVPSYANHLLTFFGEDRTQRPDQAQLYEPLSDRELEVLRLLPTELTGPEIAQRLLISLNTLRTHTKNIYGKLNANNRRAAVRRAEDMNLL